MKNFMEAETNRHWEDAVDLAMAAPPFDYNPSAWSQRIPICILALAGALIASYLSLYQLGLISSVWDPFFGNGSERVLTSRVARSMDRLLHIPDAALGALGYLSEAIFGLAGSIRRWQFRPWMVILFGIDVIPLGGVSAILVVMQGFVVGSWCTLCLVIAAISFVLVYLAFDEVWACLSYLRRLWHSTGSKWLVLKSFWGFASREADAAAFEAKANVG